MGARLKKYQRGRMRGAPRGSPLASAAAAHAPSLIHVRSTPESGRRGRHVGRQLRANAGHHQDDARVNSGSRRPSALASDDSRIPHLEFADGEIQGILKAIISPEQFASHYKCR
jgi:hypothetical protein